MTIPIPYAQTHLNLEVPDARVAAVLQSQAHHYQPSLSQEGLVQQALEHPIGAQRVSELSRGKDKVLVITSDHTRPVPSKVTLPILLREIRKGNPKAQIRILIATGFHRLTTKAEMLDKFGADIVDHEELVNHDSRDEAHMVFKGILPSGGELWLNASVDWADLVVSEGFIEPHFFAGYSGGRKSVLPGIASQKTVLANHCSKFIADPRARAGNLTDNPLHRDMLFAAEVAKLQFILNVVIDSEKHVIEAFAGHPEKAHAQGCQFVQDLASVKKVSADIVVTSNGGYPLDQNIYQAVKGMTAGEVCVNPGGVLIMVAACNDGHGGEEFYHWFQKAQSPQQVADKIAQIAMEDTVADQWEAQILARILLKCTVILVTDQCPATLITDMHMRHATTLEQALRMAEALVGAPSKITVIPDGVSVIVLP